MRRLAILAAAAMLRQQGRPGFVLSERYFSYETYALALPRADSAFRLLVDKTLAALYRSAGSTPSWPRTSGMYRTIACSRRCS